MVVARDEQLQCQWCVHTCVHACACKCCCDHGGPRRPSVQVQAKPSCPSSRIILDPTLPNVLIHARCLLTNAHVVADASYVEVRKAGNAKKFSASRLKIAHECDLALLSLEDDGFWADVSPLDFGPMPSLQDEVSVVGYPTGGDGVSVTEGVVSRIEIQTYEHSGVDLLAVQIDAAVNPGNSGGPVLNEDSLLIGVAFQNQQNSQNIGYVIPVPVIEHFLKDTDPQDPSRSQGFCSLGIFYQGLENDQLRESLALEHRTGVYVRGLLPLSPAQGLVFPGDVLLELENRSISNDGTFYVGFQERLSFVYLIQLKFPGQKVSVKLWRPGTGELSLQVPVFPLQPLVPITVQDSLQPWFLYGGMLFVVLTVSESPGSKWLHDAPVDLVMLQKEGLKKDPEEQIVILSKCYPSRRTAGYSLLNERYGWIQQLHSTEEFIHFNLSCVGSDMRAAVATETAEEVNQDVMRVYRIPADASLDLREGST
ncbi:unnamed protein product [Durusdinium trenchii]|uniref:Protease Do-like PDZ domain-containing protein n=1 Tax=Durusdinium trenchii TaxID=1381693 RepID=A0ABP0PLX1_9DINO